MNTNTIRYETGAKSHAINDLILFTDNTRNLAEHRDKIYMAHHKESARHRFTVDYLKSRFMNLYIAAIRQYKKEFPQTTDTYLSVTSQANADEFCTLYANDFATWKKEHNINS